MAKRRNNGSYIPELVIADGSKGNLWEGLITAIDDARSIRKGQSPAELNWVTSQKGDNIQLRGGKLLVGSTRRIGGHVSGMGIGTLPSGTQQVVYTANQSIYYYDNAGDTRETTTPNMLGPAANGEDTNIIPYTNQAGAWLYITSPHSSIYKIPAANPRSAADQNVSGILSEYKFGFAKIDQGRFQGMNRFGANPSSRDATGRYIGGVDLIGNYASLAPTNQNTTYPMSVSDPLKPTGTAQGGGFLASNTYYYVVTAVIKNNTGNLYETTQSQESTGVAVNGTSTTAVLLAGFAIAGAAYYNIYRTTSTGTYGSSSLAGNTLKNQDPTAGTFLDTVAATVAGTPPLSAPTNMSIVNPIATGDGSTKSFSGTLVYNYPISVPYANYKTSPPTGFAVQITDGVERFNDDGCGNLVGSLGGTGAIDYSTGAYSVTFSTAPANGSGVTYFSLAEASTYGGVLDFTQDSSDDTLSRAQPPFPQADGGGVAMGMASFQGISYDLHQLRTWNFQISLDDAGYSFLNDPYWSKIGIPYSRGFFETGDGVLFIDNTDSQNPKVSVLEIPPNSTNLTVVPVSISDDLDLSMFSFSKALVYRFGEYDFMACIESVNGIPNSYNSKMFMRNIYSGNWNVTDLTPSCLSTFQGNLLMGDALSPNVFQIFSGFDDDGGPIENYWNTSYYDCGLQGLKQIDYVHVTGLIQPNQSIQLSLSLDFGNYVKYFTIQGGGSYVNKSIQVEIGGTQIGSSVIGSGSGGGTVANPFEIDIPVFTDNFEYISAQFMALEIGYAEVDKLSYKGVRHTQRSILPTQAFNQ